MSFHPIPISSSSSNFKSRNEIDPNAVTPPPPAPPVAPVFRNTKTSSGMSTMRGDSTLLQTSMPSLTRPLRPPPPPPPFQTRPCPLPPPSSSRPEFQMNSSPMHTSFPIRTQTPNVAPCNTFYPTNNSYDSSTFPCSPSPPSPRLIQDEANASPRLIQSITQQIPQHKSISDKIGIGIGVLCTPLSIPTKDSSNLYSDESNTAEFVPLVIRNRETSIYSDDDNDDDDGGGIDPIRCEYCGAYWNPFVKMVGKDPKEGGDVVFICNFCEKRNRIQRKGHYKGLAGLDATTHAGSLPLQYGTVEYEVGGQYKTKFKDGKEKQRRGVTYLFALDAGEWDKFLVYLKVLECVIADMKEFWMRRWEDKRQMFPEKEDPYESPRIGFFIYVQDCVLIPHWIWRQGPDDRDNLGEQEAVADHWELSVSLMTDVTEDPFCPLPLSLWTYPILQPSECKSKYWTRCKPVEHNSQHEIPLSKLSVALQQLPSILCQMIRDYECRSTKEYSPNECNSWNCGGAALKVLTNALYHVGGRGMVLTSSRLNYGIGSLHDRQGSDTSKYIHLATEKSLYTSQQELGSEVGFFYRRLAEECVEEGVSLNIMMSSPLGPESGSGIFEKHYIDMASMGELCRHTCGKLNWLKYQDSDFHIDFSTALHREGTFVHQLKNELLQYLCTDTGHDASFKLRTSSGVRIKSYVPQNKVPGEINAASFTDCTQLILPCVEPDTCIAIELDHRVGGIPNSGFDGSGKKVLYLQSALLYTNPFGHRRVRVSTLALHATESVPEIYRTVNWDALAAFIIRQSISNLMGSASKRSLEYARQEIMNTCVNILANYRKHGGEIAAKRGQVAVPQSLQFLPLFCHSLLRSRLFRPSLPNDPSSMYKPPSPTADERAFQLFHCSNICPSMAMLVVHPRLYDLGDISQSWGQGLIPHSTHISEPNYYNNIDDKTCHISSKLYNQKQVPYVSLPPSIKPSVSSLTDGGIYLLDNGFSFFLFIGKNVSLDTRAELLSIVCSPNIRSNGMKHVSLSTLSDLGIRIWRVISHLRTYHSCQSDNRVLHPYRSHSPSHTPLIVIIGTGGPGSRTGIDSLLEEQMMDSLVEDTSTRGTSYEDFWADLSKRIKSTVP